MRLIDADPFGVIFLQGKSVEGAPDEVGKWHQR